MSEQREKPMTEYRSKDEKPFKVGDLVRDTYTEQQDLALVTEILYDYDLERWYILAFYQLDGHNPEHLRASDFILARPKGKTDD
jgi:hypothetical protein